MHGYNWLHNSISYLCCCCMVVVPLPDIAGHHKLEEVADKAGLVDRLKDLALRSYYLLQLYKT